MSEFAEAIENTYHQAAYWAQAAAEESMRPFVLLKPSMARDGNKWSALYGSNIQEGVCGFGDSPDEASRDFDREWFKKLVTS